MKFKLNKKGISGIKTMCRKRALPARRKLAEAASGYLLNFGYHSFLSSGPNGKSGPGWSAYYAANWNCSVKNVDCSVITPERDPFNEKEGAYLGDLWEKIYGDEADVFWKAEFGDMLYVTNSVYYGRWLNDGGIEFLTHNNESHPNRFLELCEAYLRDELKKIIKVTKDLK